MGMHWSTPAPARILTEEEKEYLVHLGITAGCPKIIVDAIKSGDVFHTRHMEKALAMRAEWERDCPVVEDALRRRGDLGGDSPAA